MVKTLVIGAKGFVGRHFFDFYRRIWPDTIGCHYKTSDGLYPLDLHDFSLDFIPDHTYEYALIACGITKPKECEQNPEKTHYLNVEQTLKLAKALLTKNIIPILFSTDYIFDGSQEFYKEETPYSPLNQYGKEKAELEMRAKQELGKFLMIRTSKIYGTTKGDGSIFDQMAHQLSTNQSIKAAIDQIFCPIHIEELTSKVYYLQKEKKFGVFNFASKESGSRYNYAKTIGKALGKEHLVTPVLLDELYDGVKRPKKVILHSLFSFSSAFENILQLVKQYT